jgi:hypothetical protein
MVGLDLSMMIRERRIMIGWSLSMNMMTFKCMDHEIEDCPTCEEEE